MAFAFVHTLSTIKTRRNILYCAIFIVLTNKDTPMKHVLFTIHGENIINNETGFGDVVVYYHPYIGPTDGLTYNYWVSYKNGGDLARFNNFGALVIWLKRELNYWIKD